MKKTVLVIGGTGLIGSNVVRQLLLSSKYEVISFSRHKTSNCTSFIGDVTNFYDLEKIYESKQIDITVITYGLKSIGNSSNKNLYIQNDYIGLNNILLCCEKYKCKKIVYLSSSAVYANGYDISEDYPTVPKSFYAVLKLSAENLIKKFHDKDCIDYVILRCFNVVGYFENNSTKDIISLLAKNNSLNIFGKSFDTPDGTLIRDYIYVDDVANAIVNSINFQGSEIFNIGLGKGYSVLDIIKNYEYITNQKIEINFLDKRDIDQSVLVANISKANRLLNWKPNYDLEQIIKLIYKKKIFCCTDEHILKNLEYA